MPGASVPDAEGSGQVAGLRRPLWVRPAALSGLAPLFWNRLGVWADYSREAAAVAGSLASGASGTQRCPLTTPGGLAPAGCC